MNRSGLLILTALPLSCAWAADAPDPGLYEVATEMVSTELPVPPTTITTRNCLTRADLDRDISQVFADLPEGASCDIDTFEMAGGHISMALRCVTPTGDMQVETSGVYTSGSYSMSSIVTMPLGDRMLTINSKIEGKRVGEC